jgi:hypothetical protein
VKTSNPTLFLVCLFFCNSVVFSWLEKGPWRLTGDIVGDYILVFFFCQFEDSIMTCSRTRGIVTPIYLLDIQCPVFQQWQHAYCSECPGGILSAWLCDFVWYSCTASTIRSVPNCLLTSVLFYPSIRYLTVVTETSFQILLFCSYDNQNINNVKDVFDGY